MGTPDETRHLVVRQEEAVICPSWSIHMGAGSGRYAFVWAMGGENQDYDDIERLSLTKLR
jgi:4-deoxy-L-threo-5-hexosulose-uronate ketol-isomerase